MNKFKFLKRLFIILICTFTLNAFGQMLEPGDPGDDPVGEDPLGGGAPLGSGVIILLSLGTIYGSKKIYDLKKDKK